MNVRATSMLRRSHHPVASWIAAVAIVVALAIAVTLRSPLPGEIAIMRTVQSWPISTIARAGNIAGESWVDAILAAIATATLLATGRRHLAVFVVGCALCRIVSSPLKMLVGRARPDASQVSITEAQTSYAFPSGHALGAVLCWGALAVVALFLIRRRARYLVAGGLLLVPIATGIGRMYVGAHWPTDVVGGWLIGAILIAAVAASAGSACRQNASLDRSGTKSDGSHNQACQF